MRKNGLNVHVYQSRSWCSLKSDQWFFLLNLTVRRPLHWKDFKWKKMWGVRGYLLKKRKLCLQNLKKEQKQPPVVILQQLIFYNISTQRLWLRIIRRSDHGVLSSSWIFLRRQFLTILIMVTEQLYWRKVLCGCFRLIWLWLLIAIMKRCAERCALQLNCTSLTI